MPNFPPSLESNPTRTAKRERAAKRRQREEKLRLERPVAIANPGAARTPPAAVSVNEFKQATGASHSTVSRWVRDGVIKSVKVGRRRFIAYEVVPAHPRLPEKNQGDPNARSPTSAHPTASPRPTKSTSIALSPTTSR
jgi:excisionase family DNA binding protein